MHAATAETVVVETVVVVGMTVETGSAVGIVVAVVVVGVVVGMVVTGQDKKIAAGSEKSFLGW